MFDCFRRISPKVTIGRMMVPFMRDQTLRGPKLQLYLLLKILKVVTGAKTRSFDLKFAMDMTYGNSVPDENKLGEAVKKVWNYKTMKGKAFSNIHY